MVIQGSGPLGNFATAVAKDHGAKQVLVIGAPAARLEVTKRMGADAVLNLEEVTDALAAPEHRNGGGHDRIGGHAPALAQRGSMIIRKTRRCSGNLRFV